MVRVTCERCGVRWDVDTSRFGAEPVEHTCPACSRALDTLPVFLFYIVLGIAFFALCAAL
jgi:hypothetical protein